MAYISTMHSVGDVVYAYDEDTDSVQRLLIVSIVARSANATAYSGAWVLNYTTKPLQAAEAWPLREFSDEELHRNARDAFPDRLPEVAALETTPETGSNFASEVMA